MPEDVPLGSGYVGQALLERFPNEYRGTQDLNAFDTGGDGGYFHQNPGASQGMPSAAEDVSPRAPVVHTDPDAPQEKQFANIPGIGMVAVNEGQSMGSVLPADHQMAGMGDWRGTAFNGMGDWRGTAFNGMGATSGMGGLTESIVNLAAGPELDKLARSMRKLNGSIVGAYNRLGELERQEAEAKKMMAGEMAILPVGIAPVVVPRAGAQQALKALEAVKEGYRALTGFDYMTYVLGQVFAPNANELRKVFSGVAETVGVMDRWHQTYIDRVAGKYGMGALWDRMQSEHMRLFAQAQPGKTPDADNPYFVATAEKAVQNVLGYKTDLKKETGMGDFGITALIGAVVLAVAVVAASIAAVKLAREFNAKAHLIHEQRIQYEKRMQKQREEYMKKCAQEGRDVKTCTREWAAFKDEQDEKQSEQEEKAAEEMAGPGFFQTAMTVALPVGLVIAVASAL